MNKAAQAYFQTKVTTTDQGQLLIMLYDGALRFLQLARDKMLEKDYAAKGIYISKVIDIINELANTLNLEKGGSLAENLNNLYFLCTTRLLQANLKMNVEQLDSVVNILAGLRSAYAQIIITPEARQISSEISAKLKTDASLTQRAAIVPRAGTQPQLANQLGQRQAHAAYGQTQATSIPFPGPENVSEQKQEESVTPAQTLTTQAVAPQKPEVKQHVATPVAAKPQNTQMPAAYSAPAATTATATTAAKTAPRPNPTSPKGFGAYNKNFFKGTSA